MLHTDTLIPSGADRRLTGLLTIFFLCPLFTAAIPKLTWLFVVLLAVALILSVVRRIDDWRQLVPPDRALIIFLLITLYLALNATWAAASGPAFGKAALFLAVTLTTFAAHSAIGRLDDSYVHGAAVAFVAGASLGAIFVFFELMTEGAVARWAMNSIPLIQSHNLKHVTLAQGEVTGVKFQELNRNVAILGFNLWPALLVLRSFKDRVSRVLLSSVFFLATTTSIAISAHQSSQVGLVAGLVVFCFAKLWPRFTVKGIAALWCLAFALVVPAALLAYKSDLNTAQWLPSSFRDRVAIWDDTAQRVLENPWFGIGARSTRLFRDSDQLPQETINSVRGKASAWHAHDLFLQTWYELGLVGVILIGLGGAVVVLRIRLLSNDAQPFAAATSTFFMAIAAFAWDMWQTWLICAMALTLLYLSTAAMNLDACKARNRFG
jgi:O-antigen ligase/polysaccharide polymerase Wzy-like membrane protein